MGPSTFCSGFSTQDYCRAPVEGYDTRARPFIRSEGRLRATGQKETIGARASSGFEFWVGFWVSQPRTKRHISQGNAVQYNDHGACLPGTQNRWESKEKWPETLELHALCHNDSRKCEGWCGKACFGEEAHLGGVVLVTVAAAWAVPRDTVA
jgi:hypothetical protein